MYLIVHFSVYSVAVLLSMDVCISMCVLCECVFVHVVCECVFVYVV